MEKADNELVALSTPTVQTTNRRSNQPETRGEEKAPRLGHTT